MRFLSTRRLIAAAAIVVGALGLPACAAGSQPSTAAPSATVTVTAPAPASAATSATAATSTTSTTSTTNTTSTTGTTSQTLCANADPDVDLADVDNTSNNTLVDIEVTCLRAGKRYIVVATLSNRQVVVMTGSLGSSMELHAFTNVRLGRYAANGPIKVELLQCPAATVNTLADTPVHEVNGSRLLAAGSIPAVCTSVSTVTTGA